MKNAPPSRGAQRPGLPQPAQAPAAKPKAPVKPARVGFFGIEPVAADVVANEQIEDRRRRSLGRRIAFRSGLIAVLSLVLVFGLPAFQPIYVYHAIDGAKQVQLVPLMMPNLTNRAVLSWAESSITEIMTIGFGDFERKLVAQKARFTPTGWNAFVASFLNQKIDETFRKNQLVLTTVPSGIAEIVSQGENDQQVYQWKIKMPVIMTYATNNNVNKREQATVTLTIVRSPESPNGIAIETWSRS